MAQPTTTLSAAADLPAETLSYAYNNAQGGILASLTSSLVAPTATLFTGPTYINQELLSGWASGANAQTSAKSVVLALAYDGDLRLASVTFSYAQAGGSGPTTLARSQPTYDAAGNVIYVLCTGWPWRYSPSSFPPWQAVFYHYRRFRLRGRWHMLLTALRYAEHERLSRDPYPSAAIMDAQSVKTVEESAHQPISVALMRMHG